MSWDDNEWKSLFHVNLKYGISMFLLVYISGNHTNTIFKISLRILLTKKSLSTIYSIWRITDNRTCGAEFILTNFLEYAYMISNILSNTNRQLMFTKRNRIKWNCLESKTTIGTTNNTYIFQLGVNNKDSIIWLLIRRLQRSETNGIRNTDNINKDIPMISCYYTKNDKVMRIEMNIKDRKSCNKKISQKSIVSNLYPKSCNHKRISKYYLLVSITFGISGTIISLMIRFELDSSSNRIMSYENLNIYLLCITLHGLLMIFYLVMPFLIGSYGNYLLPICLGASEAPSK